MATTPSTPSRHFPTLTPTRDHPEWTLEPTPEMLAILFARSEGGGKVEGPTLAKGAARRESGPSPSGPVTGAVTAQE